MAPFQIGERVQLSDAKDRKFTVTLEVGGKFHTHKGIINHDDIIGNTEGTTVSSTSGTQYLALRPLMTDFVMSMPRGATIVYPKDTAQIVIEADIFPGAKVLEAGAGSGALTCALLRAVGDHGSVVSYEIREDHAKIAQKNIINFFGSIPGNWSLNIGDITDATFIDSPEHPQLTPGSFDRVVLDMLLAHEALPLVARYLRPGGVLICYVVTVTQLSVLAEAIKEQGCWTQPRVWETLQRGWHVEGLAVRPDHRMQAHTAFLLLTRRLTDGVKAPEKYLHSGKRYRMSQQARVQAEKEDAKKISFTQEENLESLAIKE